MTRKISFTLIELLVVIAIIAIMAALLMPALAKARDAAKRISETNLMRQMHLAAASYGSDFSDRIIVHWNQQNGGNKYAYYVGYYLGAHNNLEGSGLNVLCIKKYSCYDDGAIVANPYWPSFYWHVPRLGSTMYDGCWFYSNSKYDREFNIDSGYSRILQGLEWPRFAKISAPSSQVLSRCPARKLSTNTRSHDNWRNNLFFDGHVKRIFQPLCSPETSLGD